MFAHSNCADACSFVQMVDFVAPRALEEREIPAIVEQYR